MDEMIVKDMDDLEEVARVIAGAVSDYPIVLFHGQMGAGKTTTIKKVCQALGVTDTVTSPTFALVNEYRSAEGKPIYHFDFYRIKSIEEAFDIGYEEYFYSGHPCLVEWGEKIAGLLPRKAMHVNIEKVGERTRRVAISFSE